VNRPPVKPPFLTEFLRCGVWVKHFVYFQSETSVFNFLRCTVDGALNTNSCYCSRVCGQLFFNFKTYTNDAKGWNYNVESHSSENSRTRLIGYLGEVFSVELWLLKAWLCVILHWSDNETTFFIPPFARRSWTSVSAFLRWRSEISLSMRAVYFFHFQCRVRCDKSIYYIDYYIVCFLFLSFTFLICHTNKNRITVKLLKDNNIMSLK